MAVAAHSAGVGTVRAALIDPPLGMVTIELGTDEVAMVFSDGDRDRVPRSAVRAMERDEYDVVAHWAGTPVALAFANTAESARMFDELGGFDADQRTFTFMVDEVNEERDHSKRVERRSPGQIRNTALGVIGSVASVAV